MDVASPDNATFACTRFSSCHFHPCDSSRETQHENNEIFLSYLAINFVFIAFAQNITFNEQFGFVIIFNNLLQILLVGILWIPAIF
jgi:hypothetical protein